MEGFLKEVTFEPGLEKQFHSSSSDHPHVTPTGLTEDVFSALMNAGIIENTHSWVPLSQVQINILGPVIYESVIYNKLHGDSEAAGL